ncbi:hypothetical protein, partial [Helicobacter rodentium]|uniref:hypothetical protein n=1 Tax=Helicobacter rodentium TaxID=59617 RepID=UPI0025B78BE3
IKLLFHFLRTNGILAKMALSARIHIMNCHETPCVSRNEVVVSAIIKVDSANIESRNDKVENLFF